ncbi:hypothetical protein WKI65_43545 [Streptomyces sp. MS1.AVA.3]|uniref:hypothetical protein n=1 Tax=Streptomyces decoyicus TaxID=249567 RepID=UPI0030BB871C
MPSLTLPAPPPPIVLPPTDDPTPVEKAVADGITADFEPETFLWITFHRPAGGVRIWYAWTMGGAPLGDRVDGLAMGMRLDSADWFHITDRHRRVSARGRVQIQAHALRPILGDVQAGLRGREVEREKLRRMICMAAELRGEPVPADPGPPRWLGVGPTLLHRASVAS